MDLMADRRVPPCFGSVGCIGCFFLSLPLLLVACSFWGGEKAWETEMVGGGEQADGVLSSTTTRIIVQGDGTELVTCASARACVCVMGEEGGQKGRWKLRKGGGRTAREVVRLQECGGRWEKSTPCRLSPVPPTAHCPLPNAQRGCLSLSLSLSLSALCSAACTWACRCVPG